MESVPTSLLTTDTQTLQKELPEELRVFEQPFYQIERKITLMLRLGKLLMENGANSKHIARDLRRCAAYLGIPEEYVNLHISYHTLMVNINDGEHSQTALCHVSTHTMDMNRLAALSKLPWKALDNQYTIEHFDEELHKLCTLKAQYPAWLVKLGICVGCGSLTMLFGGTFIAAIMTMFATLTGLLTLDFCQHFHFNIYINTAIAAFVAMSTSALMHTVFPSQEAFIYSMISCTLFMIPGIPMVNAVDDLFNNHIVSGMTRFTHTILTVASMTFGIAMALHFIPEPDFTNISIVPNEIYLLQLTAAFFAATGFAILFNAPIKLLPMIGLGGLICIAIRNFLIVDYAFYTPGAAFIGAAIIGLAMTKLSNYFDTSQIVLAIPSVVPLIPGVFFYRFLFAIIEINHLTPEGLITSMQNGVTAVLIIMSIAVGITVSNIFGQHYMDIEKKKKIDFFLQERQKALSNYWLE